MNVDKQFKATLENIMSKEWEEVGRPKYNDGGSVKVKRALQVVHRYDLSKEFPLGTIRPVNLKGAIKEILWIYQKRSVDTKELGLKIWDQWKNENDEIPGCYGDMVGRPVLMNRSPYSNGEEINGYGPLFEQDEWMCVGHGFYNQVDFLLHELKHNKSSRRMIISMFDPYTNNVKPLQECAFQVNFSVQNDTLHMTLYQRSLDFITAGLWNPAQYAALQLMFAHDAGLKPGNFVHFIQDAHVYDRHEKQAMTLLERPIYGEIPQVTISSRMEGKVFYDFTEDDFEVWNYNPMSQIKFEVAK